MSAPRQSRPGIGPEAQDPHPEPRSGRFRRDVVWNLASLAVLGVSGVALNVLIGRTYDESALGVFNQVLAAYILFSQLAVGGVNLSALKSIAEEPENRERTTAIVVGSLVLVSALAGLATLAYVLVRDPVARWLESPGVATGILASAPGLFFFALNKVLLAAVNGLRRMRAFAIYTALRYLLILTGLLVWVTSDPDRSRGDGLGFVFTFSEAILFLVLAVEVGARIRLPVRGAWKDWVPAHFAYGAKSVASGVMLELNAKVDVWMIGLFMADREVGIYAFAAMFAEGVFQLIVVLQNNYNPILSRQIARGQWDELRATVSRGLRRIYVGMAGVAVIAIAVYPGVVGVLTDKPGFSDSWAPFSILMLGILSASGYASFSQILLMAGQPGWHSVFMIATVVCNVIGNWILIPRLGLSGAATATALSLCASVFILKALVAKRLGVRI